MNIVITLTLAEIQTLLNIIGELPNKTATFPLAVKIKDQADAAVAAQQVKQEASP